MGEKGPEWLQPQQALGVAAQNGVPLFWGEGQGADRGHIGGLVPPGAVGAEEEAPGPKFSDKADKLLLFHHVQLVLRKRVSLQGGEVAVGKGGIQQHSRASTWSHWRQPPMWARIKVTGPTCSRARSTISGSQ